MALQTGGLGAGGWDADLSPDLLGAMFGALGDIEGGDGSDDDLQLMAEIAAEYAKQALYATCSNAGMSALASMIEPVIDDQADALPDFDEPNPEDMYEAIAGVHSGDTAYSCMTEGITAATGILFACLQTIIAHEAAEGFIVPQI